MSQAELWGSESHVVPRHIKKFVFYCSDYKSIVTLLKAKSANIFVSHCSYTKLWYRKLTYFIPYFFLDNPVPEVLDLETNFLFTFSLLLSLLSFLHPQLWGYLLRIRFHAGPRASVVRIRSEMDGQVQWEGEGTGRRAKVQV